MGDSQSWRLMRNSREVAALAAAVSDVVLPALPVANTLMRLLKALAGAPQGAYTEGEARVALVRPNCVRRDAARHGEPPSRRGGGGAYCGGCAPALPQPAARPLLNLRKEAPLRETLAGNPFFRSRLNLRHVTITLHERATGVNRKSAILQIFFARSC